MPNLDLAFLIAGAFLAICALAWAGTLKLLLLDTWRLLHPSKPKQAQFDPKGMAAATTELRLQRDAENRATAIHWAEWRKREEARARKVEEVRKGWAA